MSRLLVLLLALMIVPGGALHAQDDDDAAPESLFSGPVISAESASLLVQVAALEGHTMAAAGVAFHPDGALLASTSHDVGLRLWSLPGGESLAELFTHISLVKGVAFNPDGDLLATGSWDRTVAIHDVSPEGDIELRDVSAPFSAVVEPVAFSPDGALIAAGVGDGRVVLLDVVTLDEVRAYPVPGPEITALAFSPDGDLLLMAGGFPDDTAQMWPVDDTSSEPLALLDGHRGSVMGIAVYPLADDGGGDPLLLATVGDDGQVIMWRFDEGEVERLGSVELDGGWLTSAAFSVDGALLATGSLENGIRLWDVRDPAQPQPAGALAGHDGAVNAIAFSPDGLLLVSAGDDGVIRLWGLPVE